jgi:hypothetical protein
MNEVISTISFFTAVFLYPILSGPVAAFALAKVLQREEQWPRVLFWLALVSVHLGGFFLMLHTLGDLFFGPGFLACLLTPIFAAGTALGMRLSRHRFHKAVGEDPRARRGFNVGTFLIPLLQLATVFALTLLAPSVPSQW